MRHLVRRFTIEARRLKRRSSCVPRSRMSSASHASFPAPRGDRFFSPTNGNRTRNSRSSSASAVTWRLPSPRVSGCERVKCSSFSRAPASDFPLVTDSTTLVFVVKRDTIQAIDLGVGRQTLATLVDFARGTMDRQSKGASGAVWRAPLLRLYAQLVAPVEESGLLGGVRQLVIVPHGELHYVPLATLLRRRCR